MLPWAPEAFHARFPVSVKKKKKVTRLAARVFGRRPKMCWPAADEASLRTREKTSDTHALRNKSVKLVKKLWIYENHIWEVRNEKLFEIILILASYRRNFCSCEKKAWKKLACTGIEHLTALRYRCSALTWIELTSQLWAVRWIGSL